MVTEKLVLRKAGDSEKIHVPRNLSLLSPEMGSRSSSNTHELRITRKEKRMASRVLRFMAESI